MNYILLDSSRVNMLNQCPKKFEYIYENNLAPIETPEHFEVGGLIHKVLKTYYSLLKYRDRWNRKYSINDIESICNTIAERLGIKLRINIEKLLLIQSIMKSYMEYYRNDPLMRADILGVEQYFACPIGDPFISYSNEYQLVLEGRIDLLLSLNDNIIVVDHKHESAKRAFSMIRNQFLIYPLVVGSSQLIVNVIGTQQKKENMDRFYRKEFYYSKDILSEFESDLLDIAKEYAIYKENSKFPRKRNSCDIYGICAYEKVCSTSKELREERLQREYKTYKWSPFKEE